MYCSNCGAEISDGSKFCSKCGAKLNFSEIEATNETAINDPVGERVALMYSLYKSLPIYKKIDEFANKENALRNNNLPVILYILIGFCSGLIGFSILGFFVVNSSFPGDLAFLLVAVFAVVPPILIYIQNDKNNRKMIEKNKQDWSEYVKNNSIPELFVLPEDYRYYIAVEYIYSCLNDKRADNLKEALNLYVEQKDRWMNQHMTQQIMAIQRQQRAYLSFIAITNALR